MRSLLLLLPLLVLLTPACAPTLGDDDDAADDDDATGDDDDSTTDDDDSTADDDDTVGDDDDVVGDDDDSGWEPCAEEVTTLEPDEESPLGVSGNEVVAPIAGPLSADATWSATGAPTTVSFAVSRSGDPVFHDLSQPEDPPEGGPDYQCFDWLEVPVLVLFSTDDGGFDETLSASLRIDEMGGPWLSAALDWEALGGTFTFTEIDPADWDEVVLDVGNGWSGAAMAGQVNMNASRDAGGGVGEGMVGPVLNW